MVLVRELTKLEGERHQLHEEVEATYAVFERDGKAFVQINTYGRASRELPGKLSQTIQFDRSGAEKLARVLKSTFGL